MVSQRFKPSYSTETKIAIEVIDTNGKESKEFIPQQDLNNPKESILNFFEVLQSWMLTVVTMGVAR